MTYFDDLKREPVSGTYFDNVEKQGTTTYFDEAAPEVPKAPEQLGIMQRLKEAYKKIKDPDIRKAMVQPQYVHTFAQKLALEDVEKARAAGTKKYRREADVTDPEYKKYATTPDELQAMISWLPGAEQHFERLRDKGILPEKQISGLREGIFKGIGAIPVIAGGFGAIHQIPGLASGGLFKNALIAGVAGAGYETTKKGIEGEEIKPLEMAKDFGEWFAADLAFGAALKGAGKAWNKFVKGPNTASKAVADMLDIEKKDAAAMIKQNAKEKKLSFMDSAEDITKDVVGVAQKEVDKFKAAEFKEAPAGVTAEKVAAKEVPIQEMKAEPKPKIEAKIEPKTEVKAIEDAWKDVEKTQVKKEPKKLDIEKPTLLTEPKPATPEERASEKATKNFIDKVKDFVGLKDKSAVSKEAWELTKKHAGEKAADKYLSSIKWHSDFKKRFPDKASWQDMMFYREKTGNIYKGKGDTFEDVSKRLSPEAKEFVDKELPKYFEDVRKAINENPLLKDISARDFIEEIYIPHLYEGKLKNADSILKRFETKLSLNNMRKLMTYDEAFRKAGLIPKHDNLPDLMHAFDQIITRSRVNTELVHSLEKLEKDAGKKLILRSSDAGYADAKRAGYKQFDDYFLKKGSLAPALVHPDLAGAAQGVFVKEYPKQPGPLLKFLREVNDFARVARVSLSKFHHKAILESYAAATNTGKALKVLTSHQSWASKADALLANKEFTNRAVKAGLEIHPIEGMEVATNKYLNRLRLKGGFAEKAANFLDKAGTVQDKLFRSPHKTFIPRIKIMTYSHVLDDAIAAEVKQTGVAPTGKRLKEIEESIAHLTNNWFGGQRFENIAYLNDAQLRRRMRDYISYPDWTLSALREAQDMFSKNPTTRKYAQKYGKKYMSQLFTRAQIKNMAYTGLYNKDDGSIGWSWDKAHPTWKNEDPTKGMFHVQLPDVNIKIPGIEKPINPGRDEKGRRKYIREGKKIFELVNWAKHPIKELYRKTTPGIQLAVEQVFGKGLGSDIPVEPGYKRGQMVPWEGTEFGSLRNLELRLKHLGSIPVPFSLKNIFKEGLEGFVASEFGTASVGKGASLHSMQDAIEKALRKNDNKSLQKYIKVLRDEGYKPESIQRTISTIRTEIKKENNKK